VSEGYSFATVSSHPGKPAKVAVSLYLDKRALVDTYVHEGGPACT
jgi:hypothetical protein